MAISNLETIIDNIEQMIENVHADNRGRIMLPKDTLRQLLGELKASVPDEIKRFREKTKELENTKAKELEQARLNAERIMNEANEMRDKLLNENEQVRLAQQKAQEIMKAAEIQANDIIMNSQNQVKVVQEKALKEYDDSLVFMINYIQNMGNDIAGLMNNQLRALSDKLNDVVRTRTDLHNSIEKSRMQQVQNQNNQNSNVRYNPPAWS